MFSIHYHRTKVTLLAVMVLVILTSVLSFAQEPALRFDSSDHGNPGNRAPVIQPWKTIEIDPVYGGQWVVTGDIDGDGELEIVSARNVNLNDVHYTSAVVAQELDGTIKWRWGNPSIGRPNWHHDVACQIHDWDGDSWKEIILLTKGWLVELDGVTGKERRRIQIPPDATDCLVFCNVSGRPRPTDFIVKTRYGQMWVYNYGGDLLWTAEKPGGYRTSHQPRPYDIDGDGKDEIMAGYVMLNHDGSLRWILSSNAVDIGRGHLDCCRLVRRGETPADWRFIVTYCGANCMALVDGNGGTVWEQAGFHYESLNVGRMFPDVDGSQILVDVDHVPRGESPVILFDESGRRLGRLVSDYCRHHKFLDWTGDGLDEIILANARGIFDNSGKRIATLKCDDSGVAMQTGDMNGDGIVDVGIVTGTSFHIFVNEQGTASPDPLPLGCGVNFSLY